MGWVKQIPVWVWLLLAAWRLPRLLGASLIGPTQLPASGALVALFLVLATCRVVWWSRNEAKPRIPEEVGP